MVVTVITINKWYCIHNRKNSGIFYDFVSNCLDTRLTFYIVWLGKQITKPKVETNFIENRIYFQLSALMFCKQALNTGLWIDVKYAQLPMLLHLNKHWTLRRIGNELISTVLIIFFNNSCISGTSLKIRFYFYIWCFLSATFKKIIIHSKLRG